MKWGIVFLAAAMLPQWAMAEGDPFKQALAAAYAHNPALQAERAKLRATDEQVPQALSNWRPNIEAEADVGKTHQNTATNPIIPESSNLNPRAAGVTVTQPIFRGFRTVGSVDSAEATVLAGRAILQNAEQQLLLDAAKAYLDVRQGQEIVAINREIENDLQRLRNITKERFKIGDLKKTDVDQADSRLQSATVTRLQAEGELANQRLAYARLMGEAPGTLAAPDITLDHPKTLEEALTLADEHNPNVVSANYSQQAANSDVTVAEGSLLPEVNLVGSALRTEDQNITIPQRQDALSLMVKVTVPLYRTGADYSKSRAAMQTASQRQLELQDAHQKAKEAASNAWQSLMTMRDVIQGNKAVLKAADTALYGVKLEQKAGTRSTLDVLNAEQELLNAKVGLARAVHDEALAMLQLKASIGELTVQSLDLPVKRYDPVKHYDNVRDKWLGFGGGDE